MRTSLPFHIVYSDEYTIYLLSLLCVWVAGRFKIDLWVLQNKTLFVLSAFSKSLRLCRDVWRMLKSYCNRDMVWVEEFEKWYHLHKKASERSTDSESWCPSLKLSRIFQSLLALQMLHDEGSAFNMCVRPQRWIGVPQEVWSLFNIHHVLPMFDYLLTWFSYHCCAHDT